MARRSQPSSPRSSNAVSARSSSLKDVKGCSALSPSSPVVINRAFTVSIPAGIRNPAITCSVRSTAGDRPRRACASTSDCTFTIGISKGLKSGLAARQASKSPGGSRNPATS
ncbi:hypothetical protein ACFL6O_02680 [candidate division KSB1 bacterium]